jgi:tRNA-Thr(GGU) m(6)t(6)A37 methyltransferase TsaA
LTEYAFKPIGVVRSPYRSRAEAPIQARHSDAEGTIEIFEEFEEGLKDLEGFSHIWVLYLFHESDDYSLQVRPYLDDGARGVFACRAPRRPNPIGLSAVRLLSRQGNILRVKGLDMLDGTPVLDIKPYVPEFDTDEEIRLGWLEGKAGFAKDAKGG